MDNLRLNLSLDYRHGLGALQPYFDALKAGIALATHCPGCGNAWYPPRLSCCSLNLAKRWVELAGTGTIAAVTTGDGVAPFTEIHLGNYLALVSLDGASNSALGWLTGFDAAPHPGTRVRLIGIAEPVAHPVQAVRFAPSD